VLINRVYTGFFKHGYILWCFLVALSYSLPAHTMMNFPNPKITLVFDEPDRLELPKNFRKADSPFKATIGPYPTRLGLDNLRMSGSGQFSKDTLKKAIQTLPGKIWIVDLRKESHGFVNGIPISWYTDGNQGNVDESDDNIQRQEEMLFSDLNKQSSILVNKILEKKDGVIQKTHEYKINMVKAQTENSLINDFNLRYLRLGIPDHRRPQDAEVDVFLDFVKSLPQDAWLYFHCRGGKGRSTTAMTMFDILHNADQVSLEDIVLRQSLIGGSDLFKISDEFEDAWKRDAAVERKNFITRFYQYVKDTRHGYPNQSWSNWAKSHTQP